MIHSPPFSTLFAINFGFVSPGSDSFHLSGSVEFVLATVSRRDVICADILELGTPRKVRILQPDPLSCSRKEEAPEVRRMSFAPKSRGFYTGTFVGEPTCEHESVHQTSFEDGTLIRRMGDMLEALLALQSHQELTWCVHPIFEFGLPSTGRTDEDLCGAFCI